jgi:hypothetical protein
MLTRVDQNLPDGTVLSYRGKDRGSFWEIRTGTGHVEDG